MCSCVFFSHEPRCRLPGSNDTFMLHACTCACVSADASIQHGKALYMLHMLDFQIHCGQGL